MEVWTGRGLVTHYLLFAISLADRVVEVFGVTAKPDEAWILQVGRNAIDCERGVLRGKRYLIVDRDTKYTEQFRRLVAEAGAEVIRLPPLSPNLNAYAERFVRSIKHECLDKMIFIGQASLRRAVAEFMAHYHGERNHQGLDNRIIRPCSVDAANEGRIHRRQRLGGMLNYYYRTVLRRNRRHADLRVFVADQAVAGTRQYSWCNPPSTDFERTTTPSANRRRKFDVFRSPTQGTADPARPDPSCCAALHRCNGRPRFSE